MELVEYIKSLGYKDVRVVHASSNRIVLEADEWTIDIVVKDLQIYVKAYKLNPDLAMKIWSFLVKRLKTY